MNYIRIGKTAGMFINRLIIVLLLCSAILLISTPVRVHAEDSKKTEEIKKKIAELEAKKKQIQDQSQTVVEDKKLAGQTQQEFIARYENLMATMCTKKNERCADIIFTLGSYYYDEARDAYIQARDDYAKAMDVWEKNGQIGPEPANPLPNYSKAANMYKQLITNYETFRSVFEAYYQLGTIYLVAGETDSAQWAFEQVVEKAPNSPRASSAHFRLADFAYMDHDYPRALQHLEACRNSDLSPENQEMVQYRRAEITYNTGDFSKAVDLFFEYVEKCDNGDYPKQVFRQEAIEFMSVAFSDMSNGINQAIGFFKKVGGRPFEDQVLYTIGMKHKVHGQIDEAIEALQTALKKFPYYKDAPLAQQMLIECYLVKKDYAKANDSRENLVDLYWPGGDWYQRNVDQKPVLDKSRNEVRKALATVALYAHAQAQKSKDKVQYQKALKRYLDFLDKFPEDAWHCYEFSYYVADIYNLLGDFGNAAQYFAKVSMADLSKYVPYKSDYDTIGVEQTAQEKLKKDEKASPLTVSQEDAGYNAVVAYISAQKKAIATNNTPEDKQFAMPETKQLLDFIHQYQAKFPKSPNSAELIDLGARLYYSAGLYADAIRDFKILTGTFPDTKYGHDAVRMLANCYASTGEYDLALTQYREILTATQEQDTTARKEVTDLAAGAIFKKAESLRKAGDVSGAAITFKSITAEFPKSKLSDKGWFEAAVTYETSGKLASAAEAFREFSQNFTKSELRENSYIRAAEDYTKTGMLDSAASVYLEASSAIANKPDFSIPCLSKASDAYQKINNLDKAGYMYELVFERYPQDVKAPQALNNAGLLYEKGKAYEKAIRVYTLLTKNYPQSEFTLDAAFAIGLCYEKMGKNAEMAEVFVAFARTYVSDPYKQIEALVKAGDAYNNLGNYKEAQKDYELAVLVYEKYKGKTDINIASVAKAYFMQGEIRYKAYAAIGLQGTVKQVKENLKLKEKALNEAAAPYKKAIEVGVEEWTLRATYKLGLSFVDFADAIESQSIEGTTDQKIAARVTIYMGLDKYYTGAMKFFEKNIEWAYTQNISGEYVSKSLDMYMKMLFMRANSIEKVGIILKTSPVPKDLAPDEQQSYRELLEEKSLEAMDKALPLYENAVKEAAQLGIADNQWLDKVLSRIREINPASEALAIQIQPHVFKQQPVASATPLGKADTVAAQFPVPAVVHDDHYVRTMKRIDNIIQLDVPIDDKVKQLKRVDSEIQKDIQTEQDLIEQLKNQLK